MNNSIVRGSLPLVWLALVGSAALVYCLSANDPVFGDVIFLMREHSPYLPTAAMLALLTYLLGLPTKKELVAGTVAGMAIICGVPSIFVISSFLGGS